MEVKTGDLLYWSNEQLGASCWKDPRHCASIHQVRVFIGRSLLFFFFGGCGGTTKSILHPIDKYGKHLHWILQGVEAIGSSYIPVSPDFVHGKTVMQYTNPSPRAHFFHFLHHPIQPTPLFPGSPGWKFGVSSALLLREWLHWRGEFQGRSGISKVIWYEKHYPKPPHLSWFSPWKMGPPKFTGTFFCWRYIQFFHEKPWLWEEGSEGYVSFHLKSFLLRCISMPSGNSRAALLFTMPAQLDRQRLERISQLKKFPWYLVGDGYVDYDVNVTSCDF